MLKTMMLAALSFMTISTQVAIAQNKTPESLYLFEIKDQQKNFEGTYAIGLDESILLDCKNEEKNNLEYNCKIDLKTENFDINNKDIKGMQLLIVPLTIEKNILKANIVYKQRIDQTHVVDNTIMDQALQVNKKNQIKLTKDNNMYITLKKEKY